jgi:hypothetical protein
VLTAYVPESILAIIVVIYYIKVLIFIKKRKANDEAAPPFGEVALYPVFLLITLIETIVNRIFLTADSDPIEVLIVLHIFLRQGQGFLNFIAYVNRRVRIAYRKAICPRDSDNEPQMVSLVRLTDLNISRYGIKGNMDLDSSFQKYNY